MKGRTKRDTGGANLAKEDLDDKPMRYTADSKVHSEAEERKNGGKAAHGKDCKCKKCRGGMAVSGDKERARADRKPRKSGGRTGADAQPFSSARHGTPAPGRKEQMEFE